MKADFTPGEWKVDKRATRRVHVNDFTVANCSSSQSGDKQAEEEANARLIAKAPKMYATLYAITERFNNFPENERLGITLLLNDALDLINEITPPHE